MNTALTISMHPVARIAHSLSAWVAGVQRQPVARSAGPAAELLRTLSARTTLTVEQPLGLEVVCLQGTLWITHDGDQLDHVLESGCTYTAKRGGRMLVHALTEARFIVEPNDD
jgi:Protein of unknown function (DUF2917)